MRELKFRVWFEVERHMDYDPCIDTGDTLVNENFVPHFGEVWMQYTGLKDSKGKEIYEGDLVRIKRPLWDWGPDGAPMVEHLVEIKWVEETCGFRDAAAVTDGEVVGNTYENPDMLGGAS
jgi:hypothetical protein